MNKEQFIIGLSKLGIELNENQLLKLEKYYTLLVSYNEHTNLTAITKKEDVYLKHFYDSLTLIKVVDLNKNINLCDIGTGAGFPGLVLKIVFPNLSITLIDSLEKRIKFLKEVINELKLTNIEAIHSRIEEFNYIEKFDIVVTRAVSYTSTILELGCRLPKINGLFILMKGNIQEELNNSSSAILKLGYNIKNVINFKLPIEDSERNIVVLEKIRETDSKYPREFSQIKKKSL